MRRIAASLLGPLGRVWLTPAPLHEERAAAAPAFRYGGSTWRNADLDALVTGIHGLGDTVVDLTPAFAGPALDERQGPDGVHPSLAGQVAITRALVERLSQR